MKTSILRYAAMLVLMLSALTASAVPAKPGLTKKITLSDGSQIVARLVGDEHGHYWLGQDGNAYKSMDGDIYQRVDAQQVKQRAALRRQAADQRRLRRLAPRKVGEVGSITGQKKGLIILVNFTDVNFQSDNNKALYERIANEENFSDGNFKGSMYDYFKAQSEGPSTSLVLSPSARIRPTTAATTATATTNILPRWSSKPCNSLIPKSTLAITTGTETAKWNRFM